jgi:saccharopine dehydrogenase-like NADP-dependent oxidoreductase
MQIAPIIALGLASEEEMDVNGVRVKPIDVVLSKVPRPAEGFLNEDPTKFSMQDETKIVSIMLEICGEKDEKEVKYTVVIPTMNAPRQEMYDLYGTSYISVALPAVAGAKMLLQAEQPKGVIFPHDLNPVRFLNVMEDMGYTHRYFTV